MNPADYVRRPSSRLETRRVQASLATWTLLAAADPTRFRAVVLNNQSNSLVALSEDRIGNGYQLAAAGNEGCWLELWTAAALWVFGVSVQSAVSVITEHWA